MGKQAIRWLSNEHVSSSLESICWMRCATIPYMNLSLTGIPPSQSEPEMFRFQLRNEIQCIYILQKFGMWVFSGLQESSKSLGCIPPSQLEAIHCSRIQAFGRSSYLRSKLWAKHHIAAFLTLVAFAQLVARSISCRDFVFSLIP